MDIFDIISLKNRADLAEKAKKVNEIYVSDYGAKGDGVTDDTQSIKNAILAMSDWNTLVFERGKTYMISSTLFIPAYRNVNGNGAKLLATLDGVFTGGYMISINSSNLTSWDVQYPSDVMSYFTRITVAGRAARTDINGVFCASNIEISHAKIMGTAKGLYMSDDYLDRVIWKHIEISLTTDTSVYQAYTGNEGDIRTIDEFTVESSDTKLLGLKIGNAHKPIQINKFIGGGIYISGISMVKIENSHWVYGGITCEQNVNLIVENCHFIKMPNNPVIYIKNSTAGRYCNVTLKNLLVVYAPTRYTYDINSNYYELYLESSSTKYCKVIIENCYKYVEHLTDRSQAKICGINSNVNGFNRSLRSNSHMFVGESEYTHNDVLFIRSTNSGICTSGGAVNSGYGFYGTDSTYYYTMSFILDETRKIGRQGYNTGVSLSPSASSGASLLAVNDALIPLSKCDIYVYRGTAQSSWTKYAKIAPCMSNVIDSGLIVGCEPWKDCNGMHTLNGCVKLESDGTNVSAYMDATPTVGTWIKNDKIINNAPSPGGYMGWVCTVTGTQGTLNGGATTGSITSGTNSLTVSSATGLEIGNYITITGVTGVKKITAISDTTITLDSNADATVTSVAVAYSNATFKGYGLIQA